MSALTTENLARAVKLQVAQHVVRSVNGITVDSEYLASVIQEITVETQISGASLLHLYVIDPYWVVQRCGLLDTDPVSGELANDVDVNFPEGSDLWWRLAMVDGGNDLNDANLELTFIDRVVAYMQDDWGPLGVSSGTRTRAQFIKQLVDRIPRVLHVQPIKFVCPELNVIQPVASSTTNSLGTAVVQNATGVSTKANKARGLGSGAAVTVKGAPITAGQIAVVNAALGEASALGAPAAAWNALIYAGMGESSLGADAGTASNVWQANNPGNYKDTADMAGAFLQGTRDFAAPGAIAAAKRGDPVWQIANETENNAVWISSKGDSYGHQWPGGQAQGLQEAQNIVNAYGGASLASTGSTGANDVSQLRRGNSQNPDEDSWTCGQRLASEVNWNLFSNGNFLYYMDGPDLISQQPALYLSLSDDGVTWTATDPASGKKRAESSATRIITSLKYTVDDTAFRYQSTHKRRGRVQHKTAIRKPQTASQVKMNMVCGFFEFSAGDVLVFQNAGGLNGRWIVEDTTRNCFADVFTQFTLGPPVVPYPEPQASGTSATTATGLTGANGITQGAFQGVADAALAALKRQQSGHMFHYSQQRPIQYGILTDSPVNIDCSGFALACFKAAGLSDPSGNNYNGQGFTGDMITHCTQVSAGQAQPGDLCFFGSPGFLGTPASTTHVNVYVGNGKSVSMGQEGDPSIGPAAQMGPSGFLGYYHANVAASTGPQISLTQGDATGSTIKGGAFAEIGAINAIVDLQSDTWLFPPKGFTG